MSRIRTSTIGKEVAIEISPDCLLRGNLEIPERPQGMVLFVHGSGSSRFSPRNNFVAGKLNQAHFATFLMDLLSEHEEELDFRTGELRFNIPVLTQRVKGVTRWLAENDQIARLPLGYFGASTGAAAALAAAAESPQSVKAIVSRGGRPDLTGKALPNVHAPTLLIVGGKDTQVIGMNNRAAEKITAAHQVVIVPGASHLFEEPGKLEEVARLAAQWFEKHLIPE